MHRNIHKAFAALGLSDKESTALGALYGAGEVTAYKVAKQAGIKTPTAYALLDGLVHKGLVLKTPKNRGHLFKARPVSEIENLAQTQYADIITAVPYLRALAPAGSTDISIHTYRGLSETETALYYHIDELHDTEYQAMYALMHQGNKALFEIQTAVDTQLKAQGVSLRAICPDHPSLRTFKKIAASSQSHVLWVDPAHYASEYSIEIMPSFIRIVMPKQLQAVIIDGTEVASSFRQMFELAWLGAHAHAQ